MNLKMTSTIRAKKLGVLIRNARQAAGRSKKECGESIGVSSASINSFETGVKSPSLPQLELLALALHVPIEYFWSEDLEPEENDITKHLHVEHHVSLRDIAIGKIFKEVREKANLSFTDIKNKTGITSNRMKKYENGDASIPITDLELLSSLFDVQILDLIPKGDPVGKWIHEQTAIKDFVLLDPKMQAFVCKPINKPYLELAKKLSDLSANELRSVAEGILEITI